MNRPIKVEALPEYRLRLTYPDGVQGVIDLAGDVGRGVSAPLADEPFFRTVHIGQFGQIALSEDIEICPTPPTTRLLTQPQRNHLMPEVSRFYGIIVRFYYRDHPPTHFHAIYGESGSLLGVASLSP